MADMTKQRLVGALLVLFVILIAATILVKNANDNVAETTEVDLPVFESSIESAESEVIETEQEALLDPHDLGADVAAAIEDTAVKEALEVKAEPIQQVIEQAKQAVAPVTAVETKPELVKEKVVVSKPEPKPTPKVVSVPEPKTVVTKEDTGPKWLIQLASFGVKDNALALQKKVKKLGYQSDIQSAKNSQGKLIHRVRIGPETDNKQVDVIVSKVKQHLKLSPQVFKLQ
jgi:DedD protein